MLQNAACRWRRGRNNAHRDGEGGEIAGKEIFIVDYGMGNVGSIINMIKRVGGTSILSGEPDAVRTASKILLPGVGHFDMGMKKLEECGLDTALNQARDDGATILGICLGMQLMTTRSEESSKCGLGWFDCNTRKIPPSTANGERLLVPHMGWNIVTPTGTNDVDRVYVSDGRYYFVHSYFVDAAGDRYCLATTRYGDIEFASSIGSGNVQGVQFHPEKSHKYGMALFSSFVNY